MSNERAFDQLALPADTSGCYFYRMGFPFLSLKTIARDIRIVESCKFILEPNFYRTLRIVHVQRQVSDAQCDLFLKFLKPLSNAIGFHLIYNIDDCVGYDQIPAYNASRDVFSNKRFFENIKNIMNACDFVVVTTDLLKQYYIDYFNVKSENIVVIPNYLPRWWIGETYNLQRQERIYQDTINRPKIGLPLSSSHYDVKNQNGGVDDITHICDFVRATHKKYLWSFTCHAPKQLEDLYRDGKIEVVPGSDLLNYPRELWRRNLTAIIAPLQDNTFNRCKSNIKYLESSALGIPGVYQDLPCYSPYTEHVFTDANKLQNQLDNLFRDKQKYMKIIKENRHVVDYGKTNIKYFERGAWLEKNLSKWYELFSLQQKTLKFDLRQLAKKTDDSLKLNLG